MKVWISKYALTQGIYEVEGERCTDINKPDMLHVTGEYDQNYFGEGKEWHLTKDDAIKRANEVRLKKIELLKKQIAKLEKMDFIRDV